MPFEINERLVALLAVVSIVTFVASLIIVPWLLVRLPSDYFVRSRRTPSALRAAHPVLRLALLIAKNVLGVVLLGGGIAMLVLPGQGLLTMVLGISLIDFPGKYALERALVRRRAVHKSINWIRRKGGREPIEIPAPRRTQATDISRGS